jgi:hypothetical protein
MRVYQPTAAKGEIWPFRNNFLLKRVTREEWTGREVARYHTRVPLFRSQENLLCKVYRIYIKSAQLLFYEDDTEIIQMRNCTELDRIISGGKNALYCIRRVACAVRLDVWKKAFSSILFCGSHYSRTQFSFLL